MSDIVWINTSGQVGLKGIGRTAATRGSTRWPQVDPKGMGVVATLV